MSESNEHNTNYTFVWVMLGVLMLVSVCVSLLGLSPKIGALIIFVVAGRKAFLVIKNYMHLGWENPMIYIILLVPLVLFVILFYVLHIDMTPLASGGK